ncbi:MAG: ABC transporter permease [Acidimicrobiia bacterium]
MRSSEQVSIIAKREFLQRARTRVFQFTLVGLSALVIGGIVVLSLVSGESEPVRLGVDGDSPDSIVSDIELAADALEADVVVVLFGSADDAIAAVEDGTVYAALIEGDTIVANTDPSGTVTTILTAAANASVRRDIATELGLSESDVAAILAPVEVSVVALDPETDDPDTAARSVASFLAAVVLLTTIMMFGQFVAMGVVEEKQNRVIEVILSKVRTTSLLIGKVLGIGALGLVQVGAIGISVVIGLVVAPLPDLGVPNLASIGISAAIWLLVWFVLGYMVYSFMYAALGATVSRIEDLQSVAFLPALAILPAYFLIVGSLSTESTTSPLVRIASFVPLWSPIVMPFRINGGTVEPWEVAVSIVIILLTTAVLVRVGARVYRGAALRTGGRVSLREAWRSASS